MTEARARVAAVLADGRPRATAELARLAGVGSGIVRGMAQAGLLEPVALPARAPFDRPDPAHPGPTLSPEQAGGGRGAAQRRGGAASSR